MALRDEVSFLKEARQEGQHQGIEGTLRKQIALKFGELPAWAEERLTQANDAQLDVWVKLIRAYPCASVVKSLKRTSNHD